MIDLSKLSKQELIDEFASLINKDNSLFKEIKSHQSSIQRANNNIANEVDRLIKERYSYESAIKNDKTYKGICSSFILAPILFLFLGDGIADSLYLDYETVKGILALLFVGALLGGIALLFSPNPFENDYSILVSDFKANTLPGLLAENEYVISQKQIISDLKNRVSTLESERIKLREEYNLAKKYHYYEYNLYTYLKENRADNLKEAIEIFELEKHRSKVKEMQMMQYAQQCVQLQQIEEQISKQSLEIESLRSEASDARRDVRRIKNKLL